MLRQVKNGFLLNLKIVPNSSKNEILVSGGVVKIKITAQPVDGKANKALVEFLSKELKVPKTSIEIVKGATSKEKTVLFHTLEEDKIKIFKDIFEN